MERRDWQPAAHTFPLCNISPKYFGSCSAISGGRWKERADARPTPIATKNNETGATESPRWDLGNGRARAAVTSPPFFPRKNERTVTTIVREFIRANRGKSLAGGQRRCGTRRDLVTGFLVNLNASASCSSPNGRTQSNSHAIGC